MEEDERLIRGMALMNIYTTGNGFKKETKQFNVPDTQEVV